MPDVLVYNKMTKEYTKSLEDYLWKYKWEVGFTTLGLFLAGVLYSHRASRPQPLPLSTEVREETLTTSSESYFDKNAEIQRVVNQISLEDTELLTFEDVRTIYINSLDIIRDQYTKFTREIRKRRRLIRKINEEQYLNMVLDYEGKVKDLLERGRIELAVALGISLEVYDESIFQIQQRVEKEEFYRLEHICHRLVKEKMLKKRRMSEKTAKDIMSQQLKFLKSKLYRRYEQTLKKREVNEATVLAVIHTIIEDFIYEKYGFEEQHLILKRLDPKFSEQEEVKDLAEALEEEEEILVSEIVGCICEDTPQGYQ